MSVKSNVNEFWKFFVAHQREIERVVANGDMDQIKEMNQKVNNECVKACGCYCSLTQSDDFFELTFEPNDDKTSQLLCVYTKHFTPGVVKDSWIVNDCIPPMSEKADHLKFNVQDLVFGIEDLSVAFEIIEGVKESFVAHVNCSAFEWMEEKEAMMLCATFLQHTLGDVIVQTHLNGIEYSFEQDPRKKYVQMKDAYLEVLDVMEEHDFSVYTDCTQTYTIYKCDADQLTDEVLKDRVLVSTINPNLFVETMNHERYSCDELNRLGGEYGYLILEIEAFNEAEAQRKRILEKELNDLLLELGIARCIGSAIAQTRVYFEMMIFDKELFKKAMVKIVEQLKLPITYRPL